MAQGQGPGRGHGSQNGGHGAAGKTKAARVCRPGLGPRAAHTPCPSGEALSELPLRSDAHLCARKPTPGWGQTPESMGGDCPRNHAALGSAPVPTRRGGNPSFMGHWVKYSERFCLVVE